MAIKYICLLMLFFSISLLKSQNKLGSWNILNIKYNINDKLNVYSEAQLRSLKFYDHYHYYENVGGVIYNKSKAKRLTLAIGNYQTYREGGNFKKPKNNDEIRIWPQVTLFQELGFIKIEHRYRLEFRFTKNEFRNRLRYRFGLIFPFGKENITYNYKPFQIIFSDEIFFSNIEPYFERNRLLLALNYKILYHTSFQIGYLHQFDYKIYDEIGRNFFQIGLFHEIQSAK